MPARLRRLPPWPFKPVPLSPPWLYGLTAAVALLGLFSSLAAAAADLPLERRQSAAQQTAERSAACQAAQPFYWEIGDARGPQGQGRVGTAAPQRDTVMAIASASKWLYAAWVAEQRQGLPSSEDQRFLSFRSGYTRFRVCRPGQSLGACQSAWLNGRGQIDPATEGRFDYNGGHMQAHAVKQGLGGLDGPGLARTVSAALAPGIGMDGPLEFSQPQPAGGARSSAAYYAAFLQAQLRQRLRMAGWLGFAPVCTQPRVCPGQAVHTPIPASEAWHYSLGHWVEDDPLVGDGAFSSPGAFGFYPWISADRQWYGVLAREQRRGIRQAEEQDRPAVLSVDCGRQIRAAWMSGRAAD